VMDDVTLTVVCRHCGHRFERPRHGSRYGGSGSRRIRSVEYCSSACRQAAYRRRRNITAGIPASTRKSRPSKRRLQPRYAFPGSEVRTSVTRAEFLQRDQAVSGAEKMTFGPVSRRVVELGSRIVPDAVYPGMYRVRRPDGSLSDMVNLTRAKDAARCMRRLQPDRAEAA